MSRSAIWATLVFVVFAFATLMVFFWIKDGSLSEAGASMDSLLGKAGNEVTSATGSVVDATGNAIDRATDGDEKT
jgi:hypothetical protein